MAEIEEFRRWRTEVCEVLRRLSERPSAPAELEELRRLVEHADWRILPRVLAKMTTLALLEPELKRFLPDTKTAERWMMAEKAHRLEVVREYAGAAGADKVVVKYMRYRPLDPATYEFFELLELRCPGLLPIHQREIEGAYIFDHRTRASMTALSKEEFLRRYGGKRLVAVVHISRAGEEYFIEELDADSIFESEVRACPETRRARWGRRGLADPGRASAGLAPGGRE